MRVLVTGAAGFIGAALAAALLERGDEVVGIDNLNDYYDVGLKEARLARLQAHPKFSFARLDVASREGIGALFAATRFDAVAHLAAQAGVRYSIENPHAYADGNLVGFLNILEGCRHGAVGHLVFASSSSVYGASVTPPFSENDSVDHPISLYAATKKANELMAHSYAHLYGLPCTGLRFFTVYGPWGRPDMAVWSFTERILAGKPIDLFDHGRPQRDFTFIDDIVEGVVRVLAVPPTATPSAPAATAGGPDPGTSWAPFRVLNIGGSKPNSVLEFVSLLESALGRTAEKRLVDAQPGDVFKTEADTTRLTEITKFVPQVTLGDGLQRWAKWYKDEYIPNATAGAAPKSS
jgi:UDP-glucuronate 4-epimerase